MKRNRAILALLFLFFLTSATFVMAKYYMRNIYVIEVKDDKYTNMKPPTNLEHDFTPEVVLEGDYNKFKDNVVEMSVQLKDEYNGIFIIQLWGANGGPPNYMNALAKNSAGEGGYVLGLVQLGEGNKIKVAAGQFGYNNNSKIFGGGGKGGIGEPEVTEGREDGYGYTGGGKSVVTINRGSSDIEAMVAGGGGGAGTLNRSTGDNGGNAGTMKGLTTSSLELKGDWYYFEGSSGDSSGAKADASTTIIGGGGKGGTLKSSNNKDSTSERGGGGGAGLSDGAGGTLHDTWFGTGGGGGMSGINFNVAFVEPVTTGSQLMNILKSKGINLEQPFTPSSKPEESEKYHGGVRVIYLPGADYNELKGLISS